MNRGETIVPTADHQVVLEEHIRTGYVGRKLTSDLSRCGPFELIVQKQPDGSLYLDMHVTSKDVGKFPTSLIVNTREGVRYAVEVVVRGGYVPPQER